MRIFQPLLHFLLAVSCFGLVGYLGLLPVNYGVVAIAADTPKSAILRQISLDFELGLEELSRRLLDELIFGDEFDRAELIKLLKKLKKHTGELSILDELIQKAFSDGINQLSAGTFETFDRLRFLREVINPLTKSLLEAQTQLGVEFSENKERPLPLNYQADLLFSDNWFNVDSYAKLPLSKEADTREKLGQLLFFDPVLSSNLQRSCASCHLPERAFTDGRRRSLAIDGKGHIQRNSPTLINSVYAEKYFYDLREERLDRQIKHVVHDSLEFATDFIEIVEKLTESQTYRRLFAAAYPDYPAFMHALTDTTGLNQVPASLPAFEKQPEWNDRPIGGAY